MQQNHYIRIKDKREKQAIGLITTSMLYTTNIYCKSTNRKCREKKKLSRENNNKSSHKTATETAATSNKCEIGISYHTNTQRMKA